MSISLSLVLAMFAFAGCGKTSDDRASEESLNAEVMQLHEQLMDSMSDVRDLAAGIDKELANQEQLANQHPKELAGHTVDDLIAAKKMLLSAKSDMDRWMATYTMYDPDLKHDAAMRKLAADKENLRNIKRSLDTATRAANAALDAQEKFSARFTSANTHRTKR